MTKSTKTKEKQNCVEIEASSVTATPEMHHTQILSLQVAIAEHLGLVHRVLRHHTWSCYGVCIVVRERTWDVIYCRVAARCMP